MMRVLNELGESVLAARQHSIYDINLDSYCTRHMTPCFSLENAESYEVNIIVGNKETLRSTHRGVMRQATLLLMMYFLCLACCRHLSENHNWKNVAARKYISEHGIRTVSRNGVYLFHATLEYNSYIFKPKLLPTSSRLLRSEEIVLAATVIPSTSADLWLLQMGHLNFPDMCKLKVKAPGIEFVGEPCFCQTCVMAKMRRTPFQNQGEKSVAPKQNICFDVSGA